MNSFDTFTLAPMSGGDIIDRAVRLYRRNFLALLRIVIAPSLVAYTGSILISIGWRNFTTSKGDARVVLTVLMIFGGWLIWIIGKAFFYAVLGGSSQSLVAHFLEGKPILVRDVYRAVRKRIGSLIGATFMVGLLILGVAMIVYFALIILMMVFFMMMAAMLSDIPRWIQIIINVVFGLAIFAALIVTFLLVYSRIVYVPQILMVERKGVFGSIGRSFSLASGQILRTGVLFLFWIYVGWSVLWLFYIPLGWVSDWITPFSAEIPLWYSIAWQTITQLSEILLMPIFMLGCTLLYLDSRVRKEGFDVELLANRVLAPPPNGPPIYPPAAPRPEPAYTSGSMVPSILGLNDYSPAPANSAPSHSAQIEPSIAGGADFASATTVGRIREAAEFGPVEPAATKADSETFATTGTSPPGVSAAAGFARKTCRWCGSEANVEDRFCRVCGSVF